MWALSHRADPRALALADRHYNRQKPGTPQFVPPGRCLVLLTPAAEALWVTSWPIAEYVHHAWAGAWVNSLFRREGGTIASEMIREAVAATRAVWGIPPPPGLVTFVDQDKVRHKRDPGRCYRKAGFIPAHCPTHWPVRRVDADCAACRHETMGGLSVWQMLPADMPAASAPIGFTPPLFVADGARRTRPPRG